MKIFLPRKRFGQHFLKDRGVIASIIHALSPKTGEKIVEIGPGLGALTQPLLAYIEHLHVIEIDRDLTTRLRLRFPPDRLQIHCADALQFDFSHLAAEIAAESAHAGQIRLLGNLPYNISTPLLFWLSRFSSVIRDMHFMLQKEVVDRMVATPKTPCYGRLSVMLQYRFVMDRMFDVPPQAFDPPPKVHSSVVRILPWPTLPSLARNESVFEEVVQAAFAQRRKTLHNTLKGIVTDAEMECLGIDPGLRAECLPVDCFVKLSNFLVDRG